MAGALTHSPADVLAVLLADLGLVARSPTGSWPAFVNNRPDGPDSAVIFTDTEGRLGGKTQPDSEVQTAHGVQVYVRAAEHATAYAKANALAVAMDTVTHRLTRLGGVRYVVKNVSRTGDVIRLGNATPESSRQALTINVLVSVRRLA